MYAVVRTYAGPGAKELFDLLERRKDDVERVIRAVNGFVAYSLIRTKNGGVAVTVCRDKQGTDESLRVAREWILENTTDLETIPRPPEVSEGPAILQLG